MFKLGDRVKTKAEIIAHKNGTRREWRRFERRKELRGIVAGVRTVKEGYTTYEGEDGSYFTPKRHIRCYLVAVNLGHMIKVLPEDLEAEGVSGEC